MWGLLVHSHNVLTRYAQCFLPQSKSKLIFYTSISYQSKCKKCVMRYGSGMQTRTLIFAELLKEREILHFFLLVLEITSAFPTHLSPILPFSCSSQHYPRVNIHLKRILVLVPFEFFSTLLPHIPALFPHSIFHEAMLLQTWKFSPKSRTVRVPRHHCCWKEGPSDDPLQSSCYFL